MGFSSKMSKLREKYEVQTKEPIKAETVSSGNLMLDWAIGSGGIPRGCSVDLFGLPSLGKTTMVLSIMGERTKFGERCAFIDVEHRLTQSLIDTLIPNQKMFEVIQPKDGDSALALLKELIAEPEFRVVTVDSMSVIVPSEMTEEGANPDRPGLAAKRITQTLSQSLTPVYANRTIVFLLHQMRANMSFFSKNPSVPTSNYSTQHLTSLRLAITSNHKDGPSEIKDGDNIIGQRVKITVVKNTFGPPGKIAPITIMYGKGLDKVRDLIDCGIITDVIQKTAGWYTYTDKSDKKVPIEIKAHGEDELVKKLMPIMPKVYERIRESMKKLNTVTETPPQTEVVIDAEKADEEK